MKLTTEIVEEKQKAIIISAKKFRFVELIKKKLTGHSVEPYFSSSVPPIFKLFRYCFLVNEKIPLGQIKSLPQSIFILIYINKKPPAELVRTTVKNLKVIFADEKRLTEDDVEKILWFALSKTKESFLRLHHFEIKNDSPKVWKSIREKYTRFLTRKNIVITAVLLFISFHLIFLPFILFSAFHTILVYDNFKKGNYPEVSRLIFQGEVFQNASEKLYSLVRPSYLFIGFSLFPENLIGLNGKALQIADKTTNVLKNSKEIQKLVFKREKSNEEKIEFTLRLKTLEKDISELKLDTADFTAKFPSFIPVLANFKKQLAGMTDYVDKAEVILGYADSILTGSKIKKYLLFFANNMELRPGGGFLGSFGTVEIGNYQIGEIKIYDVYDADGQLTAHVEPPKPISRYLSMPHWFLRDSNFSPDFLENYHQALFFLDKEMGFKDFDGAILLTTSAVQNIINAYGNIYLPDYKETINSKNFYLKTQIFTEKDFFPGSIQKRTFLSSLFRQLIINFDSVSVKNLAEEIKNSLDTKQIVVYLEDTATQTLFDSMFWSGRVIEPKCPDKNQLCLLDFMFPYDANVGANKANFFVNRYYNLKINIDRQGYVNHLLSVQYKNDSPTEIFPTGYYRNYFQLLLPAGSQVLQVTKDGTLVEDYDQRVRTFREIGFFFEVPPKRTVDIKISYKLTDKINNGRSMYQLIVQKQIGAKNSDMIMEFRLDDTLSILNKNFSPVVKGQEIFYNTTLTTDKLFLVEILKE